jgi:hypothetical protein
MKTWLKVVLIIIGVTFLVLSAIWFLAWASSDFPAAILVQFIFLFALGAIPITIVIVAGRKEKPAPVNIQQSINIDAKELVGGDVNYEKLECSNCGASLGSKDVKFTDMGVLVKCPYCDQVYTIEEKPKW